MRHREGCVETAGLARESVAVFSEMRPKGVPEALGRQMAQSSEARGQRGVSALTLIRQQPTVHIAARPRLARDALHIAPGHVRQCLLQAVLRRLSDFIEVTFVDAERLGIA